MEGLAPPINCLGMGAVVAEGCPLNKGTMKNLLLIWVFYWIPILGWTQFLDHPRTTKEERTTNAPFLNASLEEGRLYIDLPETALEEPLLLTRIGRLHTNETKQVLFKKSGDQIVLEEHRIWSETGIWIAIQNDPNLEKNILGVFPILEKSGSGYRFDITDMLFDRSLGWEVISKEPMVPYLNKVIDTKWLKNELMVKLQLGHQQGRAKIVQPVHYSFMKLPVPMEPRRFDYRMGYWNESRTVGHNRTQNYIGSITRWRLEKKNKDREISEPISPIIFTLSPDIPKKWRPYVKAGIQEWLPAFESAGFKDAIVVKEADTLDNWSRYSLGYSVIRWLRNKNIRHFGEKASGSTVNSVIDQRSGEIIKSDVLLGSSYENLMDEYFIRCAALDKRAQTYPFPDDLLGELIQSLTAHEIGHTLGIKDNNYGEYKYPLEKIRDGQWLRSMGHTPSIMNYARHNNIVQPEDSVSPNLLIQKVGPTDGYYIRWGYQEFSEDSSIEDRIVRSEHVIRMQDTVSWYRYTNMLGDFIGPTATNEVVETNDPVKASKLALKNLERAIALLPKLNQGQKDNERVDRIYKEAIELWYFTMRHVFSLVGGYDVFYKSMEQPGKMYDPIPLGIQREAMDFLMGQIFDPPEWLVHPAFMTYSRFSSHPDDVFTYQNLLIEEMLKPQFMKRLQYMETINGYEGVLKNYLEQLQNGFFNELYQKNALVSPRKRGLQLIYIDLMIAAIQKEPKDITMNLTLFVHTGYTKGIMMGQLMELKKQLKNKVQEKQDNSDHAQKGQWVLCLTKLEKVFGT